MDHENIRDAIAGRRTFAIISHPDAGKTTLTEKLLLYSGMIHTAGMVRGRKGRKAAASDWMAMEQERGISITASAMQFVYKDTIINVLDTPGHEDFSADTYRTLTAADCAIMVVDAAKGVEKQTRKLFEVCRLRGIPVLTFINKMDMPGRDPLDLIQEVENVLGIEGYAFNWPIGSGKKFSGVFDRETKQCILFEKVAAAGAQKASMQYCGIDDPQIASLIGEQDAQTLKEDLELLDCAGNEFSLEAFLAGKVTPVFFASAMTNFGVEPFFDAFIHLAPSPGPRAIQLPNGTNKLLDPAQEPFSAYVFKLQANMDKRHRDSMAFLRICSGKFDRDLVVKHHRLGREIRLSRPHGMVAGERTTLDIAYAGDVIGVINPGVFSVGDSISLRGEGSFPPLPQFQPEIFYRITPKDIGKRKSFDKGVNQLIEEGTIQLLLPMDSYGENIFAAVGKLQFEVMQYRLKDEYGVDTVMNELPYGCSAWLVGDLATFKKPSTAQIVKDRFGKPMVLFGEIWEKQYAAGQNPDHQLVDIMA